MLGGGGVNSSNPIISNKETQDIQLNIKATTYRSPKMHAICEVKTLDKSLLRCEKRSKDTEGEIKSNYNSSSKQIVKVNYNRTQSVKLFQKILLFLLVATLCILLCPMEKKSFVSNAVWECENVYIVIDLNLNEGYNANYDNISLGSSTLKARYNSKEYTDTIAWVKFSNPYEDEQNGTIAISDNSYGIYLDKTGLNGNIKFAGVQMDYGDITSATLPDLSVFNGTKQFAGYKQINDTYSGTKGEYTTTLSPVYWSSTGDGMYPVIIGILLQAQWEAPPLVDIGLNANGGTGGDSIIQVDTSTHLPNVTNITPPTRVGYDFKGYYYNGTQYVDANGNVSQDISLYTTPPTTLTAQWAVSQRILTLNCVNAGSQNYMIYIYQGGNLYQQIVPLSGTQNIILPYSAKNYFVQFVYGTFGTISFTNLTNATASGRRVTLNSFADTNITFTLTTPNLGNGIII